MSSQGAASARLLVVAKTSLPRVTGLDGLLFAAASGRAVISFLLLTVALACAFQRLKIFMDPPEGSSDAYPAECRVETQGR